MAQTTRPDRGVITDHLVVQVEHSVRCLFVYVSGQHLLYCMTFDFDIWYAGLL